MCCELTPVLIYFQKKCLMMEKWLRPGTLRRKANDTGDANPNCDTRVVTASKYDRSTIEVEEASSSKKKYSGKYTVHIWNWDLFRVVMVVNRNHSVFYVTKCCRMSA
jgi:hypothetical protein